MPIISHPLESSFSRLEKFRLYETATYYYLVGFDNLETMFRLIKINRLIQKPKSLDEIVREDDLVYTAEDIAEILKMIDEGNRTSGGLVKISSGFGVVGFVKFLDCFYLILITQRKEVGCIAGNYIYSIKATDMFPVRPRDEPETNAFRSIWKKLNKKLSQTSSEIAESRYMGLFQFVDMTKDFFFSYTYDLTHSLQHNYMHAATCKNRNLQNPASAQEQTPMEPQEIFQWNHYQAHELQEILSPVGRGHWLMPLIHGSFQQKRFSLFGKCVDLIMIARRSRHYAGTRYLKRGINVHGKAANDCEVEQIVQHEDSYRSHFCSYLQMRASIPTYWYQETSVTMPKPPILINRVDPDFRATEEHIADMFRRYSSPIIALDLVKQHEKRPRESMVGSLFRQAVEVVNESIPAQHKVRYIALDYSRITSIAKGKNKGTKGLGHPTAPGSVVGQEWKSLVESSMTGDAAQPRDNPRESPVPLSSLVGAGGSSSQLSVASGGHGSVGSGLSHLAGPGKVGSVDQQDEETLRTQPRWRPTDIKIDVLRELEDIASMTIRETGFFCNSSDYLERVRNLPAEKCERARRMGHLEQRGVLRTNCIDCLDRTNGAQFAVAMKFLTVSLQALGINSASQSLEPTSQMLVSLMEMYGEMGDRIALQYGGSEAHRKVPGGQAASSAKQSELLTSIKRYYSNAFTDMVKQDAMNVFLGCFQPTEHGTPLWDLESDYDMHNHTLYPPPPLVNTMLFDALYTDSHALGLPVIRQLIESSVKKTLTDASTDKVALVPVDSKKKLKKLLQSDDLTIRTEKVDDVVAYLKRLGVPEIDRSRVLQGYFIRNQSALQSELEGPTSPTHTGAVPATSESLPEGKIESSAEKAALPQFPSRIHLKIAIRNIGRLEKRKFLRTVASQKISSVAASWWQTALLDFEQGLYGISSANVNAVPCYVPKPYQKPPSYFHRSYPPYELSEFDEMLSLDFFASVDAAQDITQQGTSKPTYSVTPVERAASPSQSSTAASTALSKRFDREYLSGSARSVNSYAAAHMHDEYPAAAVISGLDTADISRGSIGHQQVRGGGAQSTKAGSSTDGGYADLQDTATANAGFQITRYMRKLVGGFLRKDDTSTAPTSTGRSPQKHRSGKLEWNWHHHMINYHEHRVSRKTSQLYSRYVTVAHNNLLLMEKMGNQRMAEEEYFLLLRDYNIDADNVTAMEHLSIESYVSSEINQGIYHGLPQRESAIAAHAFLSTSLVQVEAELQAAALVTDGEAKDPFAPVQAPPPPVVPSALKSGSPVKRGISFGSSGNAKLVDPTLDGGKALVRTTLHRNPGLETHIEKCLQRVQNVRGLDHEFRRMVAAYITQQATYSKDMSYAQLSTRLGTGTAENTILEYGMLFDHLSLAQDLDNIDFMARCSPAYESFQELTNLRQTLAPLNTMLKERKKELLTERTDSNTAPPSASISQQLGLDGKIPGLADDLQKDYSLDLYSRPFPYVDGIALPGLNPVQSQQFYQMDHDLYVRSTNPFMQLNEIAVDSLSNALNAY